MMYINHFNETKPLSATFFVLNTTAIPISG